MACRPPSSERFSACVRASSLAASWWCTIGRVDRPWRWYRSSRRSPHNAVCASSSSASCSHPRKEATEGGARCGTEGVSSLQQHWQRVLVDAENHGAISALRRQAEIGQALVPGIDHPEQQLFAATVLKQL